MIDPVTKKLYRAIHHGNNLAALSLIRTGDISPSEYGYIDDNNCTLLMNVVIHPHISLIIIMELIGSEHSKPDHINDFGYTALIYACVHSKTDAALAIIATGNAIPEQVTNVGDTALLWACFKNLSDVAIALIATGKSNPFHIAKSGKTAITYARRNNMTEVVAILENYDDYIANLHKSELYTDPTYVFDITI